MLLVLDCVWDLDFKELLLLVFVFEDDAEAVMLGAFEPEAAEESESELDIVWQWTQKEKKLLHNSVPGMLASIMTTRSFISVFDHRRLRFKWR